MKKQLVLSILFILLSSNAIAATTELIYSKKVRSKHREILSNDIALLKKMNLANTQENEDIFNIIEIERFGSEELLDWLFDRVKVILSEKDKLKKRLFVVRENILYRNDELPIVEERQVSGNDSDTKPTVVMANIGTAIYYSGKKAATEFGLKFKNADSDKIKITVNSPRAGVLLIGEGLFMKRLAISPDNPKSMANTISRLGTLFHEARHSDGNGKTLGFLHALCPMGHDLENYNACDRNLNGPYTVGGMITRELTNNCETCTIREKEKLKLRYLDSFDRVIKKTESNGSNFDNETIEALISSYELLLSYGDLIGEDMRAEYQEKIRNLKAVLNGSNGDGDPILSTFWDATPEYVDY